MIKECNFCRNRSKIGHNEFSLEEWVKLPIKRIDGKDRLGMKNNKNPRYELEQCNDCSTFWEYRPLYEETMHGGEPGEWVKVSIEYVKENYQDVKVD